MKDLEEIMSDKYIVITNKGGAIKGPTTEILQLYNRLTSEMLKVKGVDKEILTKTFDMAFMDGDELLDLFKQELNQLIETLNKIKNENTTE